MSDCWKFVCYACYSGLGSFQGGLNYSALKNSVIFENFIQITSTIIKLGRTHIFERTVVERCCRAGLQPAGGPRKLMRVCLGILGFQMVLYFMLLFFKALRHSRNQLSHVKSFENSACFGLLFRIKHACVYICVGLFRQYIVTEIYSHQHSITRDIGPVKCS